MSKVYIVTCLRGSALYKQTAHTDPHDAHKVFAAMSKEANADFGLFFSTVDDLSQGKTLVAAAGGDWIYAKALELPQEDSNDARKELTDVTEYGLRLSDWPRIQEGMTDSG